VPSSSPPKLSEGPESDLHARGNPLLLFRFTSSRKGSRLPRTGLLLPRLHAVGGPFIEIARTYDCLDASTFHVVSDRVSDAHESNGAASVLQFFGEPQQGVPCTDVDEVDGSEIQKRALHVGPRSQRCF